MKFFQTFGATAALLGLANAANIPSKVAILTPLSGSSVGVNGLGWMIDVVAEFSPPSGTATSAAAAKVTNLDDGFFPFLNSPNLTTFKPGPGMAAPGFVCLLGNMTTNFAGVFQLNMISNSDAQGNILEAYFSWFVGAADFGSNVNITASVFFLGNGTAPAQYTGNPMTDPNVISNVATVDFFIFGDAASNSTAAPSTATPLSITLFTPRAGEIVGIDGAGWDVDLVIETSDPAANFFAPSNGYKPVYHDNFTDSKFAPGVSEGVPGLVVLSSTSTIAGGGSTNLANLFQINAVTGVQNGVIVSYWCTWLVGAAFAGKGKPSGLTIFVVNGTAPTSISGAMPTNIVSNVVTVNFTLSGNSSSSASASASPTASGASTSASGSASASASSTSGADALAVSAGSFLLGALAFLL